MLSSNFQALSAKLGAVIDRMVLSGKGYEVFVRPQGEENWIEVEDVSSYSSNELYYMMVKVKGLPCTWSFLPNSPLVYSALLAECSDSGEDSEYSSPWGEIVVTPTTISIGCQTHPISYWENITTKQLLEMDGRDAVEFWEKNSERVLGLRGSRRRPYGQSQLDYLSLPSGKGEGKFKKGKSSCTPATGRETHRYFSCPTDGAAKALLKQGRLNGLKGSKKQIIEQMMAA